SPCRTISAWTPTGLATTGSPAAMYCNTFSPHLPRLHRSSGTQLMPMSAAANSRASPASVHGHSSTGKCVKRRKRSHTNLSRTPGEEDGVGVAQVTAEAEAAPQAARERDEIEPVAGRLQARAERGEAVAAADVIGPIDESGEMHAAVLRDRGAGFQPAG